MQRVLVHHRPQGHAHHAGPRMHLLRRKVTMQYPRKKWDANLPEHYRGAPALGSVLTSVSAASACQLCEFICPPRAIKIIPEIFLPRKWARSSKRPSAVQHRHDPCIYLRHVFLLGGSAPIRPSSCASTTPITGLSRAEWSTTIPCSTRSAASHRAPREQWTTSMKKRRMKDEGGTAACIARVRFACAFVILHPSSLSFPLMPAFFYIFSASRLLFGVMVVGGRNPVASGSRSW